MLFGLSNHLHHLQVLNIFRGLDPIFMIVYVRLFWSAVLSMFLLFLF